MTLNDLPKKHNIRITKQPIFTHIYMEYDNGGLKSRTMSVNTYYGNSLPIMNNDHIYYFYSIDNNLMRYAEIKMSSFERKSFLNNERKEKLKKLSETYDKS